MIGSFKAFMEGENQFNQRKPHRIQWGLIAEAEAQSRFNKPYKDLTPSELKELLGVLAGTRTYW
jgi:hypothetical protein